MIEALYEKLGEELFCYCLCLTDGDQALAGDLMQEAFLRAIIHVETLEPLHEKQRRAWLYKTVRNLFLDKMRKSAYEWRKQEALVKEERDDHAFDWLEAEQILLLLPVELRTLFRMRYIEGYNAAELGELFQLPPSTVRGKLSAAKKILRLKLSKNLEE